MTNMIKVSIITVVYNGVKNIEQTIKSVLHQTYSNIEYIVIDGGSTDGSLDIIKKYSDSISYWVSEADKGIYDAMNKGISKATGDLIGIINSDDWYEPDAIMNMVTAYEENTVLYGIIRTICNENEVSLYAPYPSLIKRIMIPHPTCFIPKTIYSKYGLYELKYKSCADYHLVLRLYQLGVRFKVIERVIANFRVGGFSNTVSSMCESYDMRYEMGMISQTECILKKFLLRFTNGKILYLVNKN